MTHLPQDFPELISDKSKFAFLRGECEKLIDVRKRLPEFVFKRSFARYFVIEHGVIHFKQFPGFLRRMAAAFGDDTVSYMSLNPDPVDYYHAHFSLYGLACFTPSSLDERYGPVMGRRAGGIMQVDSFQARGGDVGAFWGSSLKWAIATDRISWEIAVIAAPEEANVEDMIGLPCFNPAQVARYITNLYHTKDPSDSIAGEFNRRFFANYPV
jgi:hypothetical protein